MLGAVTLILDWLGIVVFAVTGALVASRKQMDIVGFILLGTVTGIGGGTLRDLFLGLAPVFWVREPMYLVVCAAVSSLIFFTAHIPDSRYRFLLWLDAVGLAVFAVIGADTALRVGAGPVVAVAMGGVTATFGGIIRDILGAESPVILTREIYVTAAILGATTFVAMTELGLGHDLAITLGFAIGLSARWAALYWNISMPRYKPRPQKHPGTRIGRPK